MIRTITMTWSEIAVNWLNPWVNDLNANNLDTNGITEVFWKGRTPEILFYALDTNQDAIMIAENSWDPAEKQWRLLPWKSLVMDFSDYVQTMNEFFVTGQSWDLLSIMVR